MYRAYKLSADKSLKDLLDQHDQPGLKFNKAVTEVLSSLSQNKVSQNKLKPKLAALISTASLAKSSLDADSIWDECFPEIKADVFISHSSKDAQLAKQFSGWLKTNLDLTAFIDSEIWGHSDDLLKDLDNQYCLNSGGETYSYKKRNGSTAHVHMMLSYALTRMIDRTECFFFLETSNSVTAEDAVKGTYSPWIFHELATVDTIDLKSPKRSMTEKARYITENLSASMEELKVKYPVLGRRLIELQSKSLTDWVAGGRSTTHALDDLYAMHN